MIHFLGSIFEVLPKQFLKKSSVIEIILGILAVLFIIIIDNYYSNVHVLKRKSVFDNLFNMHKLQRVIK